MKTKLICGALVLQGALSCTPSAPTAPSTSTGINEKIAAAYPVGLALASPLDMGKADQLSTTKKGLQQGLSTQRQGLGGGWASRYEIATSKINAILSGATADKNAFAPELFMAQSGRAKCFGPMVKYQNHPDFVMGMPAATGELPGGDVGIWTETEAPSGEACAAAQINSLMAGARDQTLASLMGLAALISVANDSGTSLPAPGAQVDLKTQMNALGVANVVFSKAELAQAAAGSWSYALAFAYTINGKVTNLHVELAHTRTADDAFNGTLYYRVSGEPMGFGGGNCNLASRSTNGSLRYEKVSGTELHIQSRVATFCGADIDGRITDTTSLAFGQVNPDRRYPSPPNGWSDNFNLFVATYNPEGNSGSFVFAWQAGANDSHTRVFQAEINETQPADGEAYFGYGQPMSSFDGTVLGLICNWAGPGGTHTPQPYAQRQAVRFDDTKGIFTQPTGGSDIGYAPTNSCEAAAGTTFNYDRNGDGMLDSTDGVSAGVTSDLLRRDTAASVAEAIANRGFQLPDAVGGWPAE